MNQNFSKALQVAAQALRAWPSKDILLLHHNDTDGLACGAILLTALERAGFRVQRFSLEKPYPPVLERALQPQGNVVALADFAGKAAPVVAQINAQKNLVLILDHHPTEPLDDSSVHLLDGHLFGLRGDRDIAGAATCYLFAVAMDPVNQDLAPLAVLGAVGDGFYVDGKLTGVNQSAFTDACKQDLARSQTQDGQDKYFIQIHGQEYSCIDLARKLDLLGAVGYYQGGTDKGMQLCRNGITNELNATVQELSRVKEDAFARELSRLKHGGLMETEHIQWFNVQDRFTPMGVKMIGVFCNEVKNAEFLNHEKYLAGFQHIPNRIPGFGNIHFGQTKISMRVSAKLEQAIRQDKAPRLNDFLTTATTKLGGFVDACHALAAATTVDIGKEQELISEMEKILGRARSQTE